MPSLFGRMNRLLENPFDDFFADMPALNPAVSDEEAAKEEKKDDLVGKEEQGRFAYMRQMLSLIHISTSMQYKSCSTVMTSPT